MASIEKQQRQILALHDKAMVLTVQLVSCHISHPSPERSAASILATLQKNDIPKLADFFAPDIELEWNERALYEHLRDSRAAISKISGERIRAARSAGQSTHQLLQSHVAYARKTIVEPIIGVLAYIRNCFDDEERYTAYGLTTLANIRKVVQRVRRRLKILSNRTLSFLLSGWTITALVLITFAGAVIYHYLSTSELQGSPSFTSATSHVIGQVRDDFAAITTAATAPEDDMLTKTEHVSELLSHIVENVSKFLAALIALWGMIVAGAVALTKTYGSLGRLQPLSERPAHGMILRQQIVELVLTLPITSTWQTRPNLRNLVDRGGDAADDDVRERAALTDLLDGDYVLTDR